MLTTMDTLDSMSHSSAAKDGDVEVIEPLPHSAPAAHTLGTQGSLLASLPSRIGALWTSSEPGKGLGSRYRPTMWSVRPCPGSHSGQPALTHQGDSDIVRRYVNSNRFMWARSKGASSN